MSDSRPIGIFDSGLGGLTVAKQVMQVLPNEDLIYLGDNARVPYGGRSKEIVTKFSFENAEFLIKQNVKCIVIACNTSSALAGDELKNKLNLPVFDVITPAIDESIKETVNKKVGIIGTRGTVSSGAYGSSIKYQLSNINVFSKACPLFVPFIEEGESSSPALKMVAKNYIKELKDAEIDTLILGCTHYPMIRHLIEEEVGNNVQIIDPGITVAKTLQEYLEKNNLLNLSNTSGSRKYFVTDYTERFIKVAEMFLGHKIEHNLEKALL
jgi:glutamate racemase